MTRYYLAAALAFVTLLGQAQTPTTGGGLPTPLPGPIDNPEPTNVPLDGGASLLLASGVAYGLRRLRRPRTR